MIALSPYAQVGCERRRGCWELTSFACDRRGLSDDWLTPTMYDVNDGSHGRADGSVGATKGGSHGRDVDEGEGGAGVACGPVSVWRSSDAVHQPIDREDVSGQPRAARPAASASLPTRITGWVPFTWFSSSTDLTHRVRGARGRSFTSVQGPGQPHVSHDSIRQGPLDPDDHLRVKEGGRKVTWLGDEPHIRWSSPIATELAGDLKGAISTREMLHPTIARPGPAPVRAS